LVKVHSSILLDLLDLIPLKKTWLLFSLLFLCIRVSMPLFIKFCVLRVLLLLRLVHNIQDLLNP
ncbi:hypothetical protein U1Q18_013686, partial [Sarracenia purpurea var. burkii]